MYDLDRKINDYSEELFLDLGLVSLSEEKKADIYARVKDHLHQFLLSNLGSVFSPAEVESIHAALEQEDYEALDLVLKTQENFKRDLEQEIDQEFKTLKLTIVEEQRNAKPQGTS